MITSKRTGNLKLIKALLTILFLSSLLSGCQTSSATPVVTLASTKAANTALVSPTNPSLAANPTIAATPTVTSLQSRWFKGIPCALPCVEGITPGLTTITEAYNLLKTNPSVGYVNQNSAYSAIQIFWGWNNTGEPSAGYLSSTEENKKDVEHIDLYLEISITPLELKPLLGTPTHIVAQAVPDYHNVDKGASLYQVYLIYDHKGVILTTQNVTTKLPELDENLKFNLLTLYKPNALATSQAEPLRYPGLTVWQGYKSFVEYCKATNWPVDNRRYCR